MKINNPHDVAIKEIFSDKNRVKEIIQISLPKLISEYMDFSQIKRENGSFIDEKLKEYHSDILFSIKTKENIFFNGT